MIAGTRTTPSHSCHRIPVICGSAVAMNKASKPESHRILNRSDLGSKILDASLISVLRESHGLIGTIGFILSWFPVVQNHRLTREQY